MKTKTLTKKDIPQLGENETVIIEKPSYGEECDMVDEYTIVEVSDKGKNAASISPGKMKLYSLVYCVKACPWFDESATKEQKLKAIKNIDPIIGNILFKEIEKLRKGDVTEELTKKSNSQLGETQSTPRG